jgi:HK97 family phage prohead protease
MNKTYIITEKDFPKYGIESHYDLEAVICGGSKSLPKSRNVRRRNIWQLGGRSKKIRSTEKAVSKIKGEKTDRIVKGFASTFQKDRAKDVIDLSAMIEAESDLLKAGANTVFINHDTDRPIGRVLSTKVDKNKGLYVEIMISKASDVDDIWTKIKEGVLNAFSIRLRPKKVKVVENTETHNIEEFRILSMELFEVSVVGLPMNPGASITEVVGKSFCRAIKSINKSKKRSQNMATVRKSATDKKKSVVTKEEVQSMIQEANAPMLEVMKGIQASLAAKPEPKKAKKVVTKKAASVANPLEETLKSMEATMAALSKKFERRGRRKGVSHDTTETGTDTDTTPKKTLKSVNDADTLKYVFYAANNSNEYEKLTDEERTKVKGWYLLAADVIAKGA